LGEIAGGGDWAEVVSSEAADPADLLDSAGSFTNEGASWLSSVTTALSSTSPPSGRGGSESMEGWFCQNIKTYMEEMLKKSKVQEKFDIRNNFEKTKYLGKRIGGAIWFHAAR
jgi:hypothetical protein